MLWDLSWVRHTRPTQGIKAWYHLVARSLKIDDSNCEVGCNLHITPALKGIIVEVCSLEEVAHWARKSTWGLLQTPWSLESPT